MALTVVAAVSAAVSVAGLDAGSKMPAANPPATTAAAAPGAGLSPEVRTALKPVFDYLTPTPAPVARPTLDFKLAAKAEPDDCYQEIGYDRVALPCPAGYQEAVNQSYVFSGAVVGDWLYFGTIANTVCHIQGYMGSMHPYASRSGKLVCEMAAGPARRSLGLTQNGDLRPPKVYRINVVTNALEDLTPSTATFPDYARQFGLRGAGTHNGVVFLAGPVQCPPGRACGLQMFAYDGRTGDLIDGTTMPEYANIRRGIVVKDRLYFGMRASGGSYAGNVVKWTGTYADPFHFENVANLPSEPGYIAEHNGRIAVGGWVLTPYGKSVAGPAKILLSPAIPDVSGLTSTHANTWQVLFSMDDYDPEPVVGNAMHFGDLISWRGKLYFSTYELPLNPLINAWTAYGKPSTPVQRLVSFTRTARPTSIFELSNAGEADQSVRLLYGSKTFQVYDAASKKWVEKPNKLGQTPKFGKAGFGNPFNYYSWTWTLWQDRLYMGTFDATTTFDDIIDGVTVQKALFDLPADIEAAITPIARTYTAMYGGGDVWRMDTPESKAVPENLRGFGNPRDHGLRVWAPFPNRDVLLAGMATYRNLEPDKKNAGGWEIYSLTDKAPRKAKPLTVGVTFTPAAARVGANVAAEAVVTNTGNKSVKATTFCVKPKTGLTTVSATEVSGSRVVVARDGSACVVLGELAGGGSRTVNVTYRTTKVGYVGATGLATGAIDGKATGGSGTGEVRVIALGATMPSGTTAKLLGPRPYLLTAKTAKTLGGFDLGTLPPTS